jgi:hypothetical protein
MNCPIHYSTILLASPLPVLVAPHGYERDGEAPIYRVVHKMPHRTGIDGSMERHLYRAGPLYWRMMYAPMSR